MDFKRWLARVITGTDLSRTLDWARNKYTASTRDAMHDFVVSIDSEFNPELARLYLTKIDDGADRCRGG